MIKYLTRSTLGGEVLEEVPYRDRIIQNPRSEKIVLVGLQLRVLEQLVEFRELRRVELGLEVRVAADGARVELAPVNKQAFHRLVF